MESHNEGDFKKSHERCKNNGRLEYNQSNEKRIKMKDRHFESSTSHSYFKDWTPPIKSDHTTQKRRGITKIYKYSGNWKNSNEWNWFGLTKLWFWMAQRYLKVMACKRVKRNGKKKWVVLYRHLIEQTRITKIGASIINHRRIMNYANIRMIRNVVNIPKWANKIITM